MIRIIIEDGYEEGGQYDYNGIKELTCPKGLPHELAEGYWVPFWWEGDHQTPKEGVKYFYRPEIDRKYQTREVRTGNWAWYLQSQNKVHNAGMYRRYRVKPGDLVKASTYIMIVGAKSNGHGMRVGIDPTGGTDFEADTVLYSGYYSTWDPNYDPGTIEWVYQQTPQATAEGDFVTVFLHSENVTYDTDSHAHWDDNILLIEREVDVPIPPDPPDSDDPFDWERFARAVEDAAKAFAAICRGQI